MENVIAAKDLLSELRERLSGAGIEEAVAESYLFLEWICGIDKAGFFADPDAGVPADKVRRLWEMVDKRTMRVPLQYLMESCEFMGCPFYVDERVLIPRQDTECLVELALEKLSQQISQKSVEDVESIFTQKQQFIIEDQNLVADNTNSAIGNQRIAAARKNLTVLDLCTGSGCIGLSVKKYFPQAEVTLADLSGDALDVARYNAGALGLDVRFVQGDLFENIAGRFYMILSNPPYIASDEIEVLMPEVREYEPRMALDGEADGLAFYRRIVREAGDYLYPGGWLMFEIGMDQGESLRELLGEAGYIDIEIRKDLAGLDRMALGRMPELEQP